MTGKHFIQVAEELASGASEPHWRSATSRAYYAAFHVAKDALVKGGIPVPENPNSHERVYRCLNNAQDEKLAQAATGLGTLRSDRITADYKVMSESFSQNQARFDLVRAKAVITSVEKSPLGVGDPKKVAAAIEDYLRKTNQWHG